MNRDTRDRYIWPTSVLVYCLCSSFCYKEGSTCCWWRHHQHVSFRDQMFACLEWVSHVNHSSCFTHSDFHRFSWWWSAITKIKNKLIYKLKEKKNSIPVLDPTVWNLRVKSGPVKIISPELPKKCNGRRNDARTIIISSVSITFSFFILKSRKILLTNPRINQNSTC